MKDEYMGFRIGDRIRMIACADPYSPILPGEKGTVDHIDDMGTLHNKQAGDQNGGRPKVALRNRQAAC